MSKLRLFTTHAMAAMVFAAGSGVAVANDDKGNAGNYCMDVEIEPFHLMPDGSCTVRDYFDGELQKMFYPFTGDSRNCQGF